LLEDQIESRSVFAALAAVVLKLVFVKMEWASEKARAKVVSAYTIDLQADAPEYRERVQH
jgi:hypothetical protein